MKSGMSPLAGGRGEIEIPPGFSLGGRGGTLLFSKEKCPPSPRLPLRRGKNYFSSNTDTYTVPTTSNPSFALT